MKPLETFDTDYLNSDEYPGAARATELLEGLILADGLKSAVDIGGGANPLISAEFASRNLDSYSLFDISEAELAKATGYSRKTQVDMTDPAFAGRVAPDQFDLAFSHMFLEHVDDPVQVHRNIHHCLKSGGYSIHFYPSPNNLPLLINRIVPASWSHLMVKIAQPERDLDGSQGKFKAYYRLSGDPSADLGGFFGDLGFDVVKHVGYVGHFYYDRFPLLRKIERSIRPALIKARIPLTSLMFLVLQKR